jgi:4-hydroxy-tetrahydrodipicolinate reductase
MKLVISGISGKMGERITALAIQDPSVQLVGGFVEKNHPTVGKLVSGTSLTVSADASVVSLGDVMIDFSVLEALPEHVAACQKYHKALVVGTTGLKEAELALLKAASKEIPIVQSPNMSRGMNVLFKLVELAASALSSYDAEVIEAHHHFKKDAPSGSALKLGEHLAKALHRDLNQVGVHGREGLVGERKSTEIGFHAVRAGDCWRGWRCRWCICRRNSSHSSCFHTPYRWSRWWWCICR